MKQYLIIAFILSGLTAGAQHIEPLSFRSYMQKVAEGNLEYASERVNVNVSEAEIVASKVFNAPIMEVDATLHTTSRPFVPADLLNRAGMNRAARFKEQQAELQYQQALLQVENEVMQSFRRYQSLSAQVRHYEDGLLRQAQEVIDGKTYSYNRGEVSLLEVLDAQRTYADVQSQYIETLFQHSAALVELEKSVGIWDVEL